APKYARTAGAGKIPLCMVATQKMALAALVISLFPRGRMFKIPLGIASIAPASMPALVAVLCFSAPLGGNFAVFGHLVSALFGGMPLGPFHLIIAFEMWAVVWLFAILHRAGKRWLKWPAFIVGNGMVAAIPFYFLLSPAFFYASVPGLVIAASINAGVSALLMPYVLRVRGGSLHAS